MKITYYHIISKIIICYEAVISVLYQLYYLEIVDDRVFQGVNVLKICFFGFFAQYNNPMDNMSVILIFDNIVNDKFEYNILWLMCVICINLSNGKAGVCLETG